MSYKDINSKIGFDEMTPEEQEYIQRRRKQRKRKKITSIILRADAALLAALGVVLIGSVVTGSLNAKAENPVKGVSGSVSNVEVGNSSGLFGLVSSSKNKKKTSQSVVKTEQTDLTDIAALNTAPDRDLFIRNSIQYKEIEKKGYPAVPDTVPDSYTCLITRKFTLPSDYVPKDLCDPGVKFSFGYMTDKRLLRKTAGEAMKEMFDDAASSAGIELVAVSGYRSFDRQMEIYLGNVNSKGVEGADSVYAKPGGSEHQSGLTMDLSAKSASLDLVQAFGDTTEGKWLAENCHKYGFIIRYPKGKEKITGYEYEPWHIRYVGEALATYIYDNGITLDEYYGISAEDE